jgi:hypothetical protein
MSIRCECGAPVVASNVNVAAAIAKCDACGAVFSIGQAAPGAGARAHATRVIPDGFATPERAAGVMPVGYRDVKATGSSEWTYRWFKLIHVFMVFFLLFWDTISFGFVIAGLREGGMGLLSLLLPHAWIGVALSYWTLAHLFNRTRIVLGPTGLTVKSGPIPWPSFTRERRDIVAFDVHRGSNRNRGSCSVRVFGPDQRAKRILGTLGEEEANYLASELNDALRESTP